MRSLLVISGGHPYEAEPFEELIHSLGDWEVTHIIHPEAEARIGSGAADDADALLFYDMGGYEFGDGKVSTSPPSDAFKRAIMRRFAAGKGAVAMHHALAGWAQWPQWSEMLGGRFLYQPGEWKGQSVPDSGYRHDVEYQADIVCHHPVTRELPSSFAVTDELYLAEIDEESVTPLIRASHRFTRDNFYSAAKAIAGEMFSNDGWQHADGSNLVAWERKIGSASLVYLQFGDGPQTYRNPHVRKALSNALDYTATID